MRYWLFVDEAMLGPYEADQLKGVARFTPETLVCPEGAIGGSDWVPARTRGELAEIFTKPAPSPFSPQRQPAALEAAKPGEICLRCRNQAPADSLFCNKCGNALKASPKAAERPPVPETPPAPKAASLPAPVEKSVVPLAASPKTEPSAVAKAKHWLVPIFIAGTAFSAMIFVLPKILPKKTADVEGLAPIAAPAVEEAPKEAAVVAAPAPQSLAMVKPPADKIMIASVSAVPAVKKSARRGRRSAPKPAPEVKKVSLQPAEESSTQEADDQLDKLLNAGAPPQAASPEPAAADPVKEISMLPGLSRPPVAGLPKCSAATLAASLGKEPDWYYGAGQDLDVKKAHRLAILDLSRQVSGSIADSMDEAEIDQIAGPGQDWEEVAKHAGALLPASRILAEQTEERHQTCDGQSVVGIRIEKRILLRYIKENKDFKAALAKRLSKK